MADPDHLIDRDPVAYAKHFLDLQAHHPGIVGSRTAMSRLIDEAETLRTALAEACDAIVEVGGPYALRVRLFNAKLDEWRCLANPLFCPEDSDA